MSRQHTSSRPKGGAAVLCLASLVGLGVALYAYFTPLTGVTGTLGALVAILACGILAVLALLLLTTSGRGARISLRAILLLGLIGTCFAGVLLHQWWICLAMLIGLIGLLLDIFMTPRHSHTAHV